MIDGDGHIALVDFGLAKLHVSNYKGAKTMAGSPQYTAPELLLPKSKRSYGKAADWWSLGILLYEMSVGKSPFYDNNIEKMYQKIQNDPLIFPEKPELSEELKDILISVSHFLNCCVLDLEAYFPLCARCSSCKKMRPSVLEATLATF